MLFINEKSIEENYYIKDAINDLKQSFIIKEKGKINNPDRIVTPFPKHEASCLYMPSSDLENEIGAIKIVSIFPNNKENNLKTTQGVLLLTDISNGEHLCFMNASYLTRLRTGALSAIATDILARKDSKVLGVIGTGAMAFEQVLGILEVRKIDTIYLFNKTISKAEEFKNRLIKKGILSEIRIFDDVNDLVSKSDILCCATRSKTPVFDGKYLKEGTHINGIGSYMEDMREVDEITVKNSAIIVVDDLEGVKVEAGELIHAHKLKIWDFDKVYDELSSLFVKNLFKRKDEKEITFFKCVGSAYFDLSVAHGVYNKLKNSNIGHEMDI